MPRNSQSRFQAGVAPNPSPLLSVNPGSEIKVSWVSYNPPKAWPRHVESCSYMAAIPHLIRKGHKDPHAQGINKGAVAGIALGGLDTGIEAGKPQGGHWGEFKALLTENPTAPTKKLFRKVQIQIQPQPDPWG